MSDRQDPGDERRHRRRRPGEDERSYPPPRIRGEAGRPRHPADPPQRVPRRAHGVRRDPDAPRAEAPRRRHPTADRPAPGGHGGRGRHAAATVPETPGADARTALPTAGQGVLAVVAIICLVVTGIGWTMLARLDLARTKLALGGGEDGAVDILLVGSDSRTDAHGNPLSPAEIAMLRAGNEVALNTDTILVIRVPNDGSSATALSIPRDTLVETGKLGPTKINGVYGATREEVRAARVEAGAGEKEAEDEGTQAGREALVEAVGDLTGISVDHYAEVGLLGFVLLTDAVGGVDVCLNNAVDEPLSGAHFPAGEQTLSGPDALSFVRQRHGLPRGDIDRIVRQQVFMASLAGKILSAGTLTNPARLDGLRRAVERSVILDEGWDLLGFVEHLQNLSGGKVRFGTIPVLDIAGTGPNGQSVVLVDPEAVRAYARTLVGDDSGPPPAPAVPADFDRAPFTVDVLNAGNISGLAAAVSGELARRGWSAGDVDNADDSAVKGSHILVAAESDAARALSADLGGLPVVVNPDLRGNRPRVVLGNDYSGPGVSGSTPPGPTPDAGTDTGAGTGTPTIDAGGSGPRCVD